ncbi:MAG TPA: flagellar basal-body MS-ring/collar protein FliF, partial [Microthrixaceae bacterium]|nr:flagellar basal-body MS-ring/collar protein FliF [Microthrixaceae bacterium]
AGYSRRQKMIAGGAVIGVIALVLVVTRVTGRTEWGALYTDVSASDGGAIITALDEQGVPHKLANGGSTIMVPADAVYDTRLKLSDTDLPSSGKVGYGVLDGQGLTTSEFGQRVGYQRAMEGELGKTIEAIDSVETAVVHLAIPEDQVFALQDQKPTASVLIKTKGSGLNEDQVRAVVNLVASGIEGMSPDDVTVADSDGNVLAAPGQGVNASGGGGGSRQRQTAEFEAAIQKSLDELLVSVVGANGAKVSVTAELDFDKTNISKESFEQPGTRADGSNLVLEESTRDESFTGANPQTSGGPLGPDTPPVVAGNGDSDYTLAEGDVRFAVNRAVEQTTKEPGSIKQLAVAVLVDQSKVTAGQAEQLTRTLAAGANIQADRGDVLTVTRLPFDEAALNSSKAQIEAAEAAKAAAAGNSNFRNAALLIGLVLLLISAAIGYRRMLRKRMEDQLMELVEESHSALPAGDEFEDEELEPTTAAMLALAEDSDVLDLSSGTELEASSDDAEFGELVSASNALELIDPEEIERMGREASISGLIENQPEEVAALLRGWLADRRGVAR